MYFKQQQHVFVGLFVLHQICRLDGMEMEYSRCQTRQPQLIGLCQFLRRNTQAAFSNQTPHCLELMT